jgi:hypothetical protein
LIAVANHKLYIHEFIDIIGHNRANYMHHMTANFSPMAQRERNQLCYGVWGTVGTTRRWPEVVNMWEEDGWAGMARSFRHEFNHPTLQDPGLAAWWARAAQFRRSGVDRLLVPAEWTRTIEELCADGVRGECYAHELVTVQPDAAWHYVDDLVRGEQIDCYERFGWELAGAFVTAMKDDCEAIVLWAIPTWEEWAELEQATRRDPGLRAWRARQAETTTGLARFLLVDAPLSPFRTGRQPQDADRDSYRLPDE